LTVEHFLKRQPSRAWYSIKYYKYLTIRKL